MVRAVWPVVAIMLLARCVLAAGDGPVAKAQEQFKTGDFPAAIATLQAASRSLPEDAAIYYWMGRCYFELRKYDQAISEDERAVKLAPDNSEFLFWLGRAYGREAELAHSFWMALRSKDSLEEAIEANPNNVPARRDLAAFYSEAPWIVGGSKKKAREEIASIAAIDPIEGDLAQAEYDQNNGHVERAADELKTVLQQKPKRVEEYYEAADFFATRQNAALVAQAVEGAAAIAPSDPRLLYYRGVSLVLGGQQTREAESYLKAYLARTADRSDYPSRSDARTWLGQLYAKQGRRVDAAQQYQAALHLDPSSEFAKESLKELQQH